MGTIISGGAGVGKSALAMCMKTLANQSGMYFLPAKFEQNQMGLKPLFTISNLLNSLCETVFNDSPRSQLKMIEDGLTTSFGTESILISAVPSLRKLMPSCVQLETSMGICVDSAVSMRYLFGELIRILSSHSRPISFFLDDIQFGDPASLLLLWNMLFSAQGLPIFFIFCHRDDDSSMSETFKAWMTLISVFSLEPILLECISPEGVNNFISETLHLSPRISRPLSSVLHNKTRGNPLFLRQLLDSLVEHKYIFVNLTQHCWCWD